MARYAIDFTLRNPIGPSSRTDIRKENTQVGAGVEPLEEQTRSEFAATVSRSTPQVPGWRPDFHFVPWDST
jgi:hypothetical protein